MSEPKTILVIDDDPDTLATVFELLSNEGHLVSTVIGGNEALESVARRKPDLVVCDMRMPQMDGKEVLARIRFMSPRSTFIFLTAYGTCESYLEGIEMGARDMLLKPFKNAELLRVVKHLLAEGETTNSDAAHVRQDPRRY